MIIVVVVVLFWAALLVVVGKKPATGSSRCQTTNETTAEATAAQSCRGNTPDLPPLADGCFGSFGSKLEGFRHLDFHAGTCSTFDIQSVSFSEALVPSHEAMLQSLHQTFGSKLHSLVHFWWLWWFIGVDSCVRMPKEVPCDVM